MQIKFFLPEGKYCNPTLHIKIKSFHYFRQSSHITDPPFFGHIGATCICYSQNLIIYRQNKCYTEDNFLILKSSYCLIDVTMDRGGHSAFHFDKAELLLKIAYFFSAKHTISLIPHPPEEKKKLYSMSVYPHTVLFKSLN